MWYSVMAGCENNVKVKKRWKMRPLPTTENRLVEFFGLEKILRLLGPTINPPMPSPPLNHISCATSTRILSTSRDGDSTSSLGNLFQYFTTLSLIANLKLLWQKRRPIHSTLLRVGSGYQNWYWLPCAIQGTCQCSHCLCTEAGSVCSARAVSVANAQSFKHVTCLVLLLARGTYLIISANPSGRELAWLSLSAKGRAEPP